MKNKKRIFIFLQSVLLIAVISSFSYAEEADYTLDRMTVLGDPSKVDRVPGSAHYLSNEELKEFTYSDILRVLRLIPGVYIQEEDGYGLRPNIGIRGSGLDRSSRITLMEDGVLIAPAPYAAPSAYYFPTMRRMNALELVKGSAAVAHGPRTVGGVINMISTSIPNETSGVLDFFIGTDNHRETHAYIGGSLDHVGWLLETVQMTHDGFKHIDGGLNQDASLDLEDYLFKFRVNNDENADYYQSLELKLGKTEQLSYESYVGLTQADYNQAPYRRYAGSQLDNIDTEQDGIYLTYRLLPKHANWDLVATVYRTEFARNWYKVGSVGGVGISSVLANPEEYEQELSWLRGDVNSPDDAISLRNNNRSYWAKGVQGIFGWQLQMGSVGHDFEVGVRYHEDEVDRFQDDDKYRIENGFMILTTDGEPGNQANRISDAEARSIYISDEITFDKWRFTPGLRYENIDMVREDYATTDPDRGDGPTRIRESDVSVLIPGIGAIYDFNNSWQFLASVHKGYNPPSPGSNADEEESLNIEFGTRYKFGSGIVGEAIAFINDYDNLVGTCTNSTGGDCEIGDQFDGGEARVAGLEFSLGYNFNNVMDSAIELPVYLVYTYTDTEFKNSFESDYDPWGDVAKGDEFPYIPDHQLQLNLGLVGNAWGFFVNTNYVSGARSEVGSGSIPLDQKIDDRVLIDLSGNYELTEYVDLFARVENLFDEEYITSRRPAGIFVGKPRTALFGIKLHF